jgi:hypothetical protein
MAIDSTVLASVAVDLATGSRGWDKRTSEGWIDNETLLRLGSS